ncbi:MAG TPA: hypothetical protein VID48_13155 [Solirubrobacteraceae bacterium]
MREPIPRQGQAPERASHKEDPHAEQAHHEWRDRASRRNDSRDNRQFDLTIAGVLNLIDHPPGYAGNHVELWVDHNDQPAIILGHCQRLGRLRWPEPTRRELATIREQLSFQPKYRRRHGAPKLGGDRAEGALLGAT